VERESPLCNPLRVICVHVGNRIIRIGDCMNKVITLSDSDSKHLLSILQLDSLTGNKRSKDLYNNLVEQYARQTTKVDLGTMVGEFDGLKIRGVEK